VTAPLWLAGALAAVMVVIAVYCAGRLVASRWWRRTTEVDADGIHVVMGVAMAGMLVPGLSSLPGRVWEVVFGAGGAWFAWEAAQARRNIPASTMRCAHPVPHLVECAAMLYMLMAVPSLRASAPEKLMPGMSGPASANGFLPALAIILALYMAGYVLWTSDRLVALARATSAAPARSQARGRTLMLVASGAPPVASPHGQLDSADPSGTSSGTWHGHHADWPVLAPRLAACYKIVMGITMGYMLIMMV
jgi:hypothetical protein